MNSNPLDQWHQLVRERNPRGLDALLADEVVFHSPVVHTPQVGKALTRMYLMAAFKVLAGPAFHYVREVVGSHDAVLEFQTEIDGVHINGVDMMRWNDAGQIVDFKVMVRPLKAITALQQQMAALLQAGAKVPGA
ncbi:MAG TPA: nuclear transport factor 2 family protein [Xanthomonadales bacterium]|nr:nuclear transport factor 2 family protein [Xanthomonadales bacterium]